MRTAAYSGRGYHASCVRMHLHILSCFWQHFCLINSVKKDVFIRNDYFSRTRSVSVVNFFYLKLFLETKVSKSGFSLNQIKF